MKTPTGVLRRRNGNPAPRAENTPAGQNIRRPVSMQLTTGDSLTFSLDEDDGANFDIDSSGHIKTKESLDFESTESYTVTVFRPATAKTCMTTRIRRLTTPYT